MKRPKKFKIKREGFGVASVNSSHKRRHYKKSIKPKIDKRRRLGYFVFVRQKILLSRSFFCERFFPYISRVFPARAFRVGFLALTLAVISCFFVINVLSPSSPLSELKNQVLADYKNPYVHLRLSKEFLMNNDLTAARQELLIGLMVSPNNNDLKEQLRLVDALINKPTDVANEIQKWEKVVLEKPNFRDGYFRLAVSYYQLFNKEAAKTNILKALELDPNFLPAQQLLRLLGG